MNYKKIKFKLLFLLILPFVSAIEVQAATINASSCNQAEVVSAVSSANPGDTVVVPPGNVAWSTAPQVGSIAALVIAKGISLIGPGTENLTIKNELPFVCGSTGTGECPLISYDPTDYSLNTIFRLNGFTLDANGRRALKLGSSKTAPFNENTKVRVDNNRFIDSSGSSIGAGAIWNKGSLYGVVDNNIFEGFWYPIKNDPGVYMDQWWDNEPQNNFELGSYRYLYYEDNTFTGPLQTITDGQFSCRYVYRYNTIISSGVAGGTTLQLFDVHGEQPTGGMAACFGAELYGNQVTSTDNNGMKWLYFRSGQGMLFYNAAFTSGFKYAIQAYTGTTPSPCPAKYTNEKLIHNTYVWGNRGNYTGSLLTSSASADMTCNGLTNIPSFGRDVFTETSSPGVSCGIRANLPVICATGQAYWATDQSCSDLTGMVGKNPIFPISGSLYKCISENTWSMDNDGITYVPYAYPHPLRNESGTDTTPPAAPAGLTVN